MNETMGKAPDQTRFESAVDALTRNLDSMEKDVSELRSHLHGFNSPLPAKPESEQDFNSLQESPHPPNVQDKVSLLEAQVQRVLSLRSQLDLLRHHAYKTL